MEKEVEERIQRTVEKMFQAKKAGEPRFKIVEYAQMENYNSPERVALREYDRLRNNKVNSITFLEKVVRCIFK